MNEVYENRINRVLDDFHLIIDSCAMVHNLTLVTNNIAHFKRIEGLKLSNWNTPPG